MRVIIAGSRDLTHDWQVFDAVVRSGWHREISEVVCGGAKGGDAFGDAYAKFIGLPVEYFLITNNGAFDYSKPRNLRIEQGVRHLPDQPLTFENVCLCSDWQWDGPKAGPIRNERMAIYAGQGGGALIAVRRNGSKGTSGMIALAEQYGLRTYVEEVE